MEKIKVMVDGLPGKMAWTIAVAVINSKDMELIPMSLTGPETIDKHIVVNGIEVQLFGPDGMPKLFTGEFPDVNINFTHPSAIPQNVDFYAKMELPFVMGTTGGDLDYITKKVKESNLNAVVAPNMAKEIVAFQAMIEFAGSNFPGAFKGYSLEVTESHQKTKADTSGTAKAVIASFNKLGIPFTVDQINKKRSEADYESLGIPPQFWEGHGWHTYTLKKPDDSVFFQFTHNVNGRAAYVSGALEAIRFLNRVCSVPFDYCGVYSMTDVLMDRF
jgi:4-hydroxy-tetrahydrodipicolinate reductase